jgi:hypothetical protein
VHPAGAAVHPGGTAALTLEPIPAPNAKATPPADLINKRREFINVFRLKVDFTIDTHTTYCKFVGINPPMSRSSNTPPPPQKANSFCKENNYFF